MRSRLLAIALLATLGLAGCTAPAPEAVSSPTASPSTSPTPTPTPDEPVPADLVVRGGGIELYDGDGSLIDSFIWSDETEEALAVLERAFGPAPAPGIREGDGSHFPDYDTYDFGGFVYGTAVGNSKPRTEQFLPSWVNVTTGSPITGVSIHTVDGLQVGTPVEQVIALLADPGLTRPASLGTAYLFDPADPGRDSDTVSLVVDESGLVVLIDAPRYSGETA